MRTILEMIKKNKIIKQFTFLSLLLLMTNWAYSADDLSKEFKKFKRTTQKIEKKLEKLPTATTKEALIIDSAINELKEAITFAEASYSSEDIETATMTLDFIDKSVGDIMKLAPRESFSDMSDVDMAGMKPEILTEMQKITGEMKVSKEKKMKNYIQNMNTVSQKGLNVFQISYQLGDLGVQTLNLQEIAQIINDDPKLKAAVLKSIKQGLKESGLSTKEINNQIKLPEVTLASLPKTTTEEPPEVVAARKAVADAEAAKKSANDAKTTADEAKKIAEEASAKAQRLSDEAKRISWQKDSILDEALKAAQKAQEEAQEAKNLAEQAAQDYQDALDIAKEAQELADAAKGGEYVLAGSIQDRIDNKFNSIKTMRDHAKDDFTKETALAARSATDNYYEKDLAEKAAAATRKMVYEEAIGQGISPEQADILADNASTEFLDMHFELEQTKTSLMDQGMTRDEARAAAEQAAIDKYGDWVERLWNPGEPDYDPAAGDWKHMVADKQAVKTWVIGVKTLEALSNKKIEQAVMDENRKSASISALMVYEEAIKQGFSQKEAKALKDNTASAVYNGLNFIYGAYEAFKAQGYSDKEALEAAERVTLERYGDWESYLYSDDNDTDIADLVAIKSFIRGISSMKDAVANAKIGDPGKYQEEIKKAQRATNQMVFDRAKALGMSDEDAKKIADNASDYVGNFYYTAMAYDLRQGAESDDCDSACWERRDAEFNRWFDNEFKEGELRIFNEDHNWDISEGGTFIPDERAINIYLTGVLTTDASAALQEAANEAFAAAEKAKESKEDYEKKKGIADDLLEKAKSFADQSSDEAQAALAKAKAAAKEAEKALKIALRAANLSEEAKQALALAQAYYNEKLKELNDLLAGLPTPTPPDDVPKEGVYYPKGFPEGYSKNWKGKPDLKGMKSLLAQEAAKPIRKMAMGTISGNPKLAAAMNGMTDAAVFKLLESGVLPTDMVKEYIADGKNPPIEPSEFTEAVRNMDMGTISGNPKLAAAMNGMTDTDVYKLLESGILDTDMVKEYIADGENAPILPCGSSSCEMIPGTFYNGELHDPNNEFGLDPKELIGGGVTRCHAIGCAPGEPGYIGDLDVDKDALATATSGISSDVAEVASGLAGLSEEVQATAESLGIADATAAAAEAAGVDVSELMPTQDAMDNPDFDAEAHNRAMQQKSEGN